MTTTITLRVLLGIAAIAGCSADSALAPTTGTTSSATSGTFTLSSPTVTQGGALPSEYTCDGRGSSLALAWSNAPAGTKEFALLMTTLPGDGTTKWNWVLYRIPAATTSLAKDTQGVGTAGVGSDGPTAAYQAPCSQGPGNKTYTFTLYALSASPTISGTANGPSVTAAIAGLILGSAKLDVTYARQM